MFSITLKRLFNAAAIVFICAGNALAQSAPPNSVNDPTAGLTKNSSTDSGWMAEQSPIAEALDSLMHQQFFAETTTPSRRTINKYGYQPDEVPRFSDSVISFRIQHIPSPMKLSYNHHVKGFIELYAVRRKAASERMLGLANYYFPIFEEALERHGLPHQLKYLAIVESALNPVAVSRVGATGLWQFMYPTGKQYGLEADYYCDERRDPWLASDAAARHLKDLHRIYNDWLLALAAYNCGAGNVNKAVRRSGGVTDYWSLMPYLPQETRGYVPAFVAVTYIMHYAAEHNLNPVRFTGLPTHIDTLHLRGPISLPALASQLGMSAQELCLLNPQFKQQEIPRSFESYPIRLPVMKVAEFERNRSGILAALQPAPVLLPPAGESSSPVLAKGGESTAPGLPASTEWVMKPTRYHSVRKGETLSTIGKRYGITAQSLKSWNKLSGTTIHTGQKLIVQRTKVPTNAPVVAEQAQASRNVAPAKAIAGTNSPALATKKTCVADSSATPTSASAQGTATSAGASSQSNVTNSTASRSSVSHNNVNPSNATHNNASHSTVSKSNTPHNNATQSIASHNNASHNNASHSTASHSNAAHSNASHSNTAHSTVSPGTAPTGALGATAAAQHTASTKSNSQPEQPQAQEGTTEQATARTAQAEAESPVQKVINYIYYTVRKGDTLWDIAQRKGMTVAELLKVNKLTPSSRLQPGQKLKIAAG